MLGDYLALDVKNISLEGFTEPITGVSPTRSLGSLLDLPLEVEMYALLPGIFLFILMETIGIGGEHAYVFAWVDSG